jgi:hypothetical protein
VIFWRGEPRFRKVVRPDQPLEKVYCDVLEPEVPEPDSPCRLVEAEVPRLTGIWAIPHRESKLLQAGGGRWFGLIGGTFPLYPALLRPGDCMDNRGKADVAYTCSYPDLVEHNGREWRCSLKGKHFRLRDDVEEFGGYQDRFGHPIYIVRNRLGETFRLAGVYARIYHILRERGGWVSGTDLLDENETMFRRYGENLKEFVDRKRDEELEDLTLEYGKAAADLAERVSELLTKLDRGEVEELSSPGTVPADVERVFTTIESWEFLFEFYTLGEFTERWEGKFNGNTGKAFSNIFYWFTGLALGLLVYEALIVEMGVE